MSETPKTDREVYTVTKVDIGFTAVSPELARILERDLIAAQARVKELEAEREQLEKLIYVPGVLRCAKCGCRLVSTTLHVNTGQTSANNEPQQCPNGCGPLWRVTERDAGNELCDRLDKEIAARQAVVAQHEAERQPKAEPGMVPKEPTEAADETAALLRDDRFTGKFIEEFVYAYTFEGDEGTHQPTENEQTMLMDCCVGLVTELFGEEFRHFCYACLAARDD